MSERDAVIGLIDRGGCKGCLSEHMPLTACCTPYVDLASECVVCDTYCAEAEQEEAT